MNKTTAAAALGLVLIAVAALGIGLFATRPAKQPNVLIILWDTVRADRMSLYGYDLSTTPRMAAWAEKQGVVYERAVSPDMWTVPSHASLFTGLPPGTHGAGFDHRWLDAERTTLAEHLGANGYDTFAFSANPNLSPKRVNLLQGFETIETSWSRKWRDEVTGHTRDKLIARDRSTEISPGAPGRHHSTGFYNAAPVAHEALVQWLDGRQDPGRPWVAYLSYMEAHKPRVPALGSRKQVADRRTIKLGLDTDLSFKNQLLYSYGKLSYTDEELNAISRVYDAALLDLDGPTADLLDDLDRRGILDDTIVVFTADHGEQLGEHQQFGHRSGVYQALLHVPLVISYPRKLSPHHVTEPVSNLEIFSTVLHLAGIDPPDSGATPGDLTRTERVAQVFAETLSIDRLGFGKVKKLYPDLTRDVWANTYRAVVQGDWKLIESISFDTHEVMDCELFNLADDPMETQDRFDEEGERGLAMAEAAAAWKAQQVPWDPSKGDNVEEDLSDAAKHQLEILGYLQEEDDEDDGGAAPEPVADDLEPLPGNRCRPGG
ncbi:MAG: sulfatase [Myxococcota bacterium]